MKKLIKEIKMGKNLEENIKKYVYGLAGLYYQQAFVESAYNYYSFYEEIMEKGADRKDLIEELLPGAQKGARALISGSGEWKDAIEALDAGRRQIMKKMEVLTAFTDRLQVYEYVINRIEKRYEEKTQETIDENEFCQALAQYIFSIKDNIVINESVKEVLAQLPVRMTKTRYFELIRNSLSLYKGSDQESAQSYLYMLRTSAMLYQPEGIDEYFPEFMEILKEFEEADYNNLTKDEFLKLEGDMEEMAGSLLKLTDLYVMAQGLYNSLYGGILSMTLREDDMSFEGQEYGQNVFRAVYEALEKGEEIKPDEIEESLVKMEGFQEKTLSDLHIYEGALEDIKDMAKEEAAIFSKIGKLMSSSLFASLEEEKEILPADEGYIKRVTEELIEELCVLFKEKPQIVKRAVMAGTLSKIPVFFASANEVLDYIKNSLEQCRDYGEKYGSIEILSRMMEEY